VPGGERSLNPNIALIERPEYKPLAPEPWADQVQGRGWLTA
jgi:hypothetical protein